MGRRYLAGLVSEQDWRPNKDTDSGCSVTSDQVDEVEYDEVGSLHLVTLHFESSINNKPCYYAFLDSPLYRTND